MEQLYSSLDDILSDKDMRQDVCEDTCCDKHENHLISDGMIVCKDCHNVVTNIIDGAEWRYYGASDSKSSDPTRCGMPVNQLLPMSSVGSFISTRGGHNKSMYKVRKYQQWGGMPYKERTLLKVFQDISRVCKEAGISEMIIKEAHVLYKLVSSTKITRGSNRKGIIAACAYFACKINEVARSTNEIASIFSISGTVMTKGCKKFQEIMQLNKVDINRIHNTNTITMDDFIDRFCSKLHLTTDDILVIKHISYLSQVYNLVNDNTPPSMAAGCIYLYIKEMDYDIHKKVIADICKISEVTINKCYKKLELHKDKLIV
jgi:transcription initiation factor TFIIB